MPACCARSTKPGVKIDLVAGRGIGAVGALFAAVDGGARLWEPNGFWRSPSARASITGVCRFGCGLVAGRRGRFFALPLALLALAVLIGVAALLLTLVGLARPRARCVRRSAAGSTAVRTRRAADLHPAARAICPAGWRCGAGGQRACLGGPRAHAAPHETDADVAPARIAADVGTVVARTLAELWDLIRGAAPIAAPPTNRSRSALRRTAVGQPRPARFPRTARHGPRRGRQSRHRVRAAWERTSGSVLPAPGAQKQRPRLETSIWPACRRDHALDAVAGGARHPGRHRPHLATFSARRRTGAEKRIGVRPAGRAGPAPGGSRRSRAPSRSFSSAPRRRRARTRARGTAARDCAAAPASTRRLRGSRPSRRARSISTAGSRVFRHSAGAQSRWSARFRRRLRRAVRPAPAARRADRSRLRRRLPPVHRAGGGRGRRTYRESNQAMVTLARRVKM